MAKKRHSLHHSYRRGAEKIKHFTSIMPAKPGTCAMCATDHKEDDAHNNASLFYQARFNMKYGRAPTWADAVAHLRPHKQLAWKTTLEKEGMWTECDDPIAEPYAISDP